MYLPLLSSSRFQIAPADSLTRIGDSTNTGLPLQSGLRIPRYRLRITGPGYVRLTTDSSTATPSRHKKDGPTSRDRIDGIRQTLQIVSIINTRRGTRIKRVMQNVNSSREQQISNWVDNDHDTGPTDFKRIAQTCRSKSEFLALRTSNEENTNVPSCTKIVRLTVSHEA